MRSLVIAVRENSPILQCGKSLYRFFGAVPLRSGTKRLSGTRKSIAVPLVPLVPLKMAKNFLYRTYKILYNILFNLSGTSGTSGTVSGFFVPSKKFKWYNRYCYRFRLALYLNFSPSYCSCEMSKSLLQS
jgi:hypothetical protein